MSSRIRLDKKEEFEMNEKGVIRRIDCLGRVTIPKEFREILGAFDGFPVEILNHGDSIVIQPAPIDGETLPYLENLKLAVEKQSWMDDKDKARILGLVENIRREIDGLAKGTGND